MCLSPPFVVPADAKKGKDGLVMDSVGTGGLNELKENLSARKGDILFFCLRVNTYDDEGSSRAKFIYGRFVGTGVPSKIYLVLSVF